MISLYTGSPAGEEEAAVYRSPLFRFLEHMGVFIVHKNTFYRDTTCCAPTVWKYFTKKGVNQMTMEDEKRFLLLLASFSILHNSQKKGPTKAEVLDEIDSKQWALFDPQKYQMKSNRKEIIWRNDLAFIRKHLAINGFFIAGVRNNWGITPAGREELKKLCQMVFNTQNFRCITAAAVSDARVLYSYI